VFNQTRYQVLYQRIQRLLQAKKTPFLVIDKSIIQQKFQEFQNAIGQAKIFYALKANAQRRIVQLLAQLGAGFEVSSEQELCLLLGCQIPPQRIISSNPVKSEAFIRAACSVGMELFAFDSCDEIEKLAKLAPGSRVYVRISVSNAGSKWPLSGKFGVEVGPAVDLLMKAGERKLRPYGITFHVGSQCTDPTTWLEALEKSKEVWDSAESHGLKLRMLNIGGGFPIKYTNPVASVAQIAPVLKERIERLFPKEVQIFVEPGRVLVGEAGVLVATVIGKGLRNGQKWLYLDVGVFNGLMESIGGIAYPIITANTGPRTKWALAGPSCDSFDIISTEIELEEPEIGDQVYIMSAGAYTTAYASAFNGFCIPKTYFI
jgi:ornithine decarboxylase